jgi:hypothetical protein
MIVQKLRVVDGEHVAFAALLDNTLPQSPDKLYREIDGRMFYIKHVMALSGDPQCQEPVVITISDYYRYLKEGDDVVIIG